MDYTVGLVSKSRAIRNSERARELQPVRPCIQLITALYLLYLVSSQSRQPKVGFKIVS